MIKLGLHVSEHIFFCVAAHSDLCMWLSSCFLVGFLPFHEDFFTSHFWAGFGQTWAWIWCLDLILESIDMPPLVIWRGNTWRRRQSLSAGKSRTPAEFERPWSDMESKQNGFAGHSWSDVFRCLALRNWADWVRNREAAATPFYTFLDIILLQMFVVCSTLFPASIYRKGTHTSEVCIGPLICCVLFLRASFEGARKEALWFGNTGVTKTTIYLPDLASLSTVYTSIALRITLMQRSWSAPIGLGTVQHTSSFLLLRRNWAVLLPASQSAWVQNQDFAFDSFANGLFVVCSHRAQFLPHI